MARQYQEQPGALYELGELHRDVRAYVGSPRFGAMTQLSPTAKSVFRDAGWLCAVSLFFWLGAVVTLLWYGGFLSAVLWWFAGVAVWSPAWRQREAQGKPAPALFGQIGLCLIFALLGLYAHPLQLDEPAADTRPKRSTPQEAAAKLTSDVILPMTREAIPEMWDKLGQAQFERANDLMKWAAMAAAESEYCNKTTSMAVTERSDSKVLRWGVNCANGERFIISEAQARIARVKFGPDIAPARRKAALALPVAEPVSSRWDISAEQEAVGLCEHVIEQSLISKSSFETTGRWELWEDQETGQATIERDFQATNGFGAKISHRYHCVVSGGPRHIYALSVRDATGWRKLI